MKRFIVITMSVILLITPLMVNAVETNGMGSAVIDAHRDANADVNGALWFGAGCLFGILGVGAAYIIEPTPGASRLIGKSSQYVAVYTDEYKRVGKSIQTKQAVIGCVVSSLAYVVLNIVYVAIYGAYIFTY
ncbi:hypothetical protein KAU43_01170 [candidate division WOR-3 bacterium]|nr:hypothetical protein [candidate division WOR-3 bacterium]